MATKEATMTEQPGKAEKPGQTQRKKARNRSPEHPAFDLQKAIEHAKTLFDREGTNYAPKNVAMQHWGYANPKSSSALRCLAALNHYGLLEVRGSGGGREVKVSELARRIILDERPQSRERLEAIQKAALSPTIYAELWEKWGPNLPSETNMRHFLLVEKGFNRSTVDSFIADFRSTLGFAKVAESGILPEPEAEVNQEDRSNGGGPDEEGLPPIDLARSGEKTMPKTEQQETRPWDLTVPLSDRRQAILRVPIPLTEKDYRLLTSFIETSLKTLKETITQANGGLEEAEA